MCRRTEEEVGPRVGLPRHRHFVGFFNVPVLAPTRNQPFLYGDSDTPTHLVAFYDHAGDTEVHILDLTPLALTGVEFQEKKGEIWLSPLTRTPTPTEKNPYTHRKIQKTT